MCIGVALNPINSTMVATALVTIGDSVGAGADQTVWLISVLYLSCAIGQPIAGRLADRIGPRRVFVGGAVIVAIAGIAGIFADSLLELVLLRALIGSGTGAAFPAGMAMVRQRADRLGLPPPNKVIGYISTASLVTLSIGPVLAGLFVDYLSWRWIFIVNLPLAVICLAMVVAFTPRDERRRGDGTFDIPGMLVFAAAVTALLVFLMALQRPRWWVLAVSLALFGVLVIMERRRDSAFIDVRMLGQNKPLMITYVRVVLGFTVVYAAMFGLSQWFEEARGLTPTESGMLLLLIFGVGAVISLVGSRFKVIAHPLLIGSISMTVGSLVMAFVDSDSPVWVYALLCLAFAPCAGLAMLANQMAIYVQAPAAQIGAATGLSRTAQYIGAIIASGVIALSFGARPDDAGLQLIGWLMCGLGVLNAVAVLLDRSVWRPAVAT